MLDTDISLPAIPRCDRSVIATPDSGSRGTSSSVVLGMNEVFAGLHWARNSRERFGQLSLSFLRGRLIEYLDTAAWGMQIGTSTSVKWQELLC